MRRIGLAVILTLVSFFGRLPPVRNRQARSIGSVF